mgnify:CR=1 FL=1
MSPGDELVPAMSFAAAAAAGAATPKSHAPKARDSTTRDELAQVARSAPSLKDRQAAVDAELEAERRMMAERSGIGPTDYGMSFDDDAPADFQGSRDSTDEQMLSVFDKPAAFVTGQTAAGAPIIDAAITFSAAASRLVAKRRAAKVKALAFRLLMHWHVRLTRARATLRARHAAAGTECPVAHGPALPVTVAFTANRVAAREGGESDADREGKLTATETDKLDRGGGEARHDLNLKDVPNPTVDGRGALDLSNIPCAFGCEGCRGKAGFDVQTLAELDTQVQRSTRAANPELSERKVQRRGWRAVKSVIALVQEGDQERAIGQRVSCRNWRCMIASGILREEDRATWLEGKQYANFSNGNKRHHSRKLFIANIRLLRQMWLADMLDREQVASAVLDVSQTTFWAESRQREFYGVALVLAKRAEDIGYPLRGRDAKQAHIKRMGQVPFNFVNTVVLDHVLSDAYPDALDARDGATGKPWGTVLTDMLKQNFPDANTTAHADMLHQNWLLADKPVDHHQNPKHQVNVMLFLGGVREALFDGAVGFDSVVGPYLASAHDYKTKLLFASAADAAAEGGDMHAAIAANAKCCGLKTIGQKAAFERLVSLNTNKRERTTALVPSAGKTLKSPHAPADNALRAAQNSAVWFKTVSALRCLNVDDPDVFAASFLADHKGVRGASGFTILPAARVFDAQETKSLAAIQRQDVFARNACAGYGTELGAARKLREAAILDFKSVRGHFSGVGLRINDPHPDELSSSAAAYVEERRLACSDQILNDLRKLCVEIRSIETHTKALITDRLVNYVERGLPTTASYACNLQGLDWDMLTERFAGPLMDRATELSDAHHYLNTFAHKWRAHLDRIVPADEDELRKIIRSCELLLEARAWVGTPFLEPTLGLTRRYTANMERFLVGIVSAHKRVGDPLPATIAKDVIRLTPLWKRPDEPADAAEAKRFALYDMVDEQAMANVEANYQKLVDDEVLDPIRFPIESYLRCNAAHFWQMAEIQKTHERKRWWLLTQQPDSRWRCTDKLCIQRHKVWSTRLGDHTCKCKARNCSFATYLTNHRIDGKHRWPTLDVERDRFCRQLIIRAQADVDRLRRIAGRTLDDSAKLAKLQAKLDDATKPLSDKERADTLKKMRLSKGRYSQELHARALVRLEHELPRTISRFCRGIDDDDTRPLADAFDREVALTTGTGAQRHCRQRAFLSGADKSIYGGSSRVAAEARAETAGLLGTKPPPSAVPAGDDDFVVPDGTGVSSDGGSDSDDDDDDDDDDPDAAAARAQRHGARMEADDARRRAEEDMDTALEAQGMAVDADADDDADDDSAFVLDADEPLDADAIQALLDITPRAALATKSKAAAEGDAAEGDAADAVEGAAPKRKAPFVKVERRVKAQLRRGVGRPAPQRQAATAAKLKRAVDDTDARAAKKSRDAVPPPDPVPAEDELWTLDDIADADAEPGLWTLSDEEEEQIDEDLWTLDD